MSVPNIIPENIGPPSYLSTGLGTFGTRAEKTNPTSTFVPADLAVVFHFPHHLICETNGEALGLRDLYGRLAGLSGLMLLFNLPGGSSLAAFCANRVQTGRRALLGNSAGAPLSGALLNATGRNWLAVSLYSGSLQIVGACVLLYGAPLRYSLFLSTTDMLYIVARFKREPKVFSRY